MSDARRLCELSAEKCGDDSKCKLRETLTTIATIGFFAIVGVFYMACSQRCVSSMLKDDAVQITFNGVFQPLVRPALGI